MSFTKTAAVLLLFAAIAMQAQKNELGKVTVKELEEKAYPTDTTAAAAILFTKAKTIYIYEKQGFYLNHIYEFRIKIYKKEGLKWANFKALYRINYDNIIDDALSFSDAVTYNLVNNQVVKTKLKSEGSFKRNLNEYWDEASVTLPNVGVGSIIEFKYVMRSENMVTFPLFNFQYNIPVKYAEYKTEVPEFFIYNPIFSGFHKVNSDVQVDFGYQNYADENNQGRHMSYKQINSIHLAENIPALKEEDFMDNLDNYKTSVDYELQKTRFPEVPEKIFTQTWEDVARVIYKDKSFGQELSLKDYFLQDLRLVLKHNDSTEQTKIKAVFKFVQNKMNWNGRYGYLTDKGVEKAYVEKTGNIADINFILISMLNYAGLNANPVLVSTTDHGIPVFPNRTVFNYVIAAVDLDGKRILLDATSKFTAPDILRFSTLNWTGRLIRGDQTSQEINLIPAFASKENNNVIATIDGSGKVTAKIRTQTSDYLALQFRQEYGNMSNENYIEKREEDWKGAQLENYTVTNKLTDLTKPIVESYTLASDNLVTVSENQMEINPLLFFGVTKNPFQQENRMLPIYFGFPKHFKYNIAVDIPSGYVIASLPKSVTMATPENVQLFSYKIVAQESKIQLVVSIENNGTLLPADFYEDLKEFYKKVMEKQTEKIILKKI